ncbi:MAG: O-antigen ligase family protein, partial [Bacteroidales bacterium]|nr:O-antigen ligase family protein [Bacteroidales bacterium]
MKENTIVLSVLLSLFVLHVVGLLWTANLQAGWLELYHKIAFLIIPLGVCIISPLKKNILRWLFYFYIAAIFVGTVVGITRYLTQDFPDLRTLIPYASNIRFAVNICFAIAAMSVITYRKRQFKVTILLFPFIVWFVFYMIITQSITGICILCVLAGVSLMYLCFKNRNKISLIVSGILLLLLLGFTFWTTREAISYFNCQQIDNKPLKTHTINGNSYNAFTNDNFIENGHYVNQYVCMEELERAWSQRTGLRIDDLSKGTEGHFAYRDLLVRYLNSKRLTKDSAGIMVLSCQDIENVKAGFANVAYVEKFSLRPRLYKTFFEFERYWHEGYVKDGSLVKRIELCKNAATVIRDYPVAGVGTGDANDVMNAYLSKKSNRNQFNTHDPHNYFFFIGVEFGMVGIAVLGLFL